MSQPEHRMAMARPDDLARDGGPAPAEGSGDRPAPDAVSVEQEIAELRRQLDELRDKMLRAQAEAVNVARRVGEEKSQAVRRANAAFARDLLPVVDDFERTLASVEGRDDPLAAGVRLIYESLVKALRAHEIRPIEAVGRPFDPAYHEALMHEPHAGAATGTVVSELARGYMLLDQVLRPARVSVARGPDDADTSGPGSIGPEAALPPDEDERT